MKAIVLETFGDLHRLICNEISLPEPDQDEVLVRVLYAGVNPYDWKVIEGMETGQDITVPLIPGSEFSGIIEKTGANVKNFKKGDPVCGMKGNYGGCYAAFTTVKATDIAVKPAALSFEAAAALPVGGLVSWKALYDAASLKKGQHILIHGASGGVGSVAVQLAKNTGAYIVATGSAKNKSLIEELGANVFIDYRTQQFEDIVKNIDVVLDTVGGDTQDKSFPVLKKGGHLISLVKPPSKVLAERYHIDAKMIFGSVNHTWLSSILELAVTGKLNPVIDEIFPLTDAIAALEYLKNGHGGGKVLLSLSNLGNVVKNSW